ncbi:hypothetical protein SFUMM280S_11393 [Streptomyces fumanus]
MKRQRRVWAALLAGLLMVLGLQTTAVGQQAGSSAQADQVLTWTAGNDITRYTSAPQTAVAGPATIVFENSEATGNTTGMPHTLTFVTSDPAYNSDVQLNILANPFDDQGGRHTAEVTLSPGRYLYHCTIPGHGEMKGVLVVTEGGGEDTTAPETAAEVSGTRNAAGAYVGSASVAVSATDAGSGVDRIEYAIGADGAWQPYTAPVVIDQVGEHTVRYRAFDKAGNAAAEKSDFTVARRPSHPPETSATVASRTGDLAAGDRRRHRVRVSAARWARSVQPRPGGLGQPRSPPLSDSRSAARPARVVVVGAGLRVEVEAEFVGVVDVAAADRPGVEGEGAVLGGPQHRGLLGGAHLVGAASAGEGDVRGGDPVRHPLGRALLVEPLAGDAVRVALQGGGPVPQGAQDAGGDGLVVAGQVQLGVAVLREEDLVRAGQPHRPAARLQFHRFTHAGHGRPTGHSPHIGRYLTHPVRIGPWTSP